MNEAYLWMTPIAVLAVLLLVRFVGCNQIFGLDDVHLGLAYDVDLSADGPVVYWGLQEKSPPTQIPGGVVQSETGNFPDILFLPSSPLTDDPQHLSPPANPLILELGAPGLLGGQFNTSNSSIRVQGGFVHSAFAPDFNTPQFTIEVLVFPEWDVTAQGRYYCVIESSEVPAGAGQSKRFGYALYAGPADPATPQTPYRWQLWVGDATGFRQLKELVPVPNATNPGPVVEAAQTYLSATFDGSQYFLYVFTPDRDVDAVRYELAPQSYAPNTSGDFSIGIAGPRRALVPPFPGPNNVLYPFSGRVQEVAIYDHALKKERVTSHILSAF